MFAAFDSLRAKVVALKHNGEFVDQITTDNSGGSAIIITDKSCFYAEKGGQVYMFQLALCSSCYSDLPI